MKHLHTLLFAAFILVIGQIHAQNQERTRFINYEYPNGKVKTRKMWSYSIPIETFSGYDSTLRYSGETRMVQQFDKQGRIKTQSENEDGTSYHTKFVYDRKGLPKTLLQYKGKSMLLNREEYVFYGDSLRRITVYDSTGNRTKEHRFTYFNSLGMISQEKFVDSATQTERLIVFNYDSLGNLCHKTNYINGVYTGHSEYFFEGNTRTMYLGYDAKLGLVSKVIDTYQGQEHTSKAYVDGEKLIAHTIKWTLKDKNENPFKWYFHQPLGKSVAIKECQYTYYRR